MISRTIIIENATPQTVAPFGTFVGVDPTTPLFAEWTGVIVYGAIPIDIGTGGELLYTKMNAATFPARVKLLERHFKHTQTYLSANGRPFVMVFGLGSTHDGVPHVEGFSALLFQDGAGIAMHTGVWHEFPLALEDDTRFTVILRQESHVNLLDSPQHPFDARGPDLERYDMEQRANIILQF